MKELTELEIAIKLEEIEREEWQEERIYSEEDMKEYANYCILYYQKKIPYKEVKEWFEKFKQK